LAPYPTAVPLRTAARPMWMWMVAGLVVGGLLALVL
jgi:hypothetical protein